MEGEQGNPGSEAGNVIASSDHAVATAPENIETVTVNDENGKEDAQKNGMDLHFEEISYLLDELYLKS
jgi:hypothetical protein